MSEEIDSILVANFQKEVFLLSNMEEKPVLWDQQKKFNIVPPKVIQCNFSTTSVQEA